MIDLVMRLPKIITLVSVIVFAASLTQNGFYTETHFPKPPPSGWYLLLIGLIGVFDGYFEWLANPVLLAGGDFLLPERIRPRCCWESWLQRSWSRFSSATP